MRPLYYFVFWCLDPGSNWGPIPLQGSALPTELSRLIDFIISYIQNYTKLNLYKLNYV